MYKKIEKQHTDRLVSFTAVSVHVCAPVSDDNRNNNNK